MRDRHEKGIALVTALLVLLLVSTIIVGLSWLVMSDQRLGGNNKDHQMAFYGAEAGMEKITSDLGNQFNNNYALSANDINTIVALGPPVLQGVNYPAPGDTSGYQITWANAPANPVAQNHQILSGPYAGLQGLLTPFTVTVKARTLIGSEVKLQRLVQTVAIPVFQFGIFSQTDLSFFAGPNFNFGGRVHTNGNLWLAEGTGSTLTLADKVTAVGQVIRTNLANGLPVPGNYDGTVNVDTVPNTTFRALAETEGSNLGPNVVGNVNQNPNNPPWNSLSIGTYNGDIRNGATGATTLTLTIATPGLGGAPIDMIRRPVPGEKGANPLKFGERYFSQASLRILISDYNPPNAAPNSGACAAADMVGLDTVTATAPIDLASLAVDTTKGQAFPAWYTEAVKKSLPESGAGGAAYNSADGYWYAGPTAAPVAPGQPIIWGCIKIEYQNAAGGWVDVTQNILNYGFTGKNLNPFATAAALPPLGKVGALPAPGVQIPVSGCVNPSPTAIIRLARLRDNPSTVYAPNPFGNGCGTATGATSQDFWPNVLFDPREGVFREAAIPGNLLTANGVMSYVELDATNLANWFLNDAVGKLANNVTGYTVYFSDRRGENVDPVTGTKTGSYGFNDIVNPGDVANGCPSGALDQGEDLEGDLTLRTYGETPVIPPVPFLTNVLPAGAPGNPATNAIGANPNPICSAVNGGLAWPGAVYFHTQDARINSPGFFRRALKIVNGRAFAIGTCDTVPCGLTVVAENPAYIQGDYNALPGGNYGGAHQATSVMADAVTFLSNNWNDVNSFISPYNDGGRNALTTTYRTAIVSGKGVSFPQVGGVQDFGTDGGTHNFLRYIENWGGQQLFYKGSIVSFYYNRQANGIYKCCGIVYDPPSRGYTFDAEFLTPQLLPPRTPMFRTINTIGFTQLLMPNQ
ncbi:MAG: PilX N-terminal domain-containing pilus assembly protein [Candidatus Acidiferrales bacterium]